ncbi:hypothetical protein [Dysgonomonas sp. GY617]|uniref:hypothetical protein n=1 Tax=Dysgonomonas sp. GY617 TaxID=2780420 RepID=UPI001884577B|nr:hypothetical protein [Dysgonomonas sp. GY617]MBF0575534.1 hypothetical protein [Dysgonomonas sp. GY617]
MNKVYELLRAINIHIEKLLSDTIHNKPLRLSEVYEYIKDMENMKQEFTDSKALSQFLRSVVKNDEGVLHQIIPSCYVDKSNYTNYKWFFFPKEKKLKKETTLGDKCLATSYSEIHNFFKTSKKYIASDGTHVRSMHELYIYNNLLVIDIFHVSYESKISSNGKRLYTDFVVKNKITKNIFRWEHFGMANNNPDYADKMVKKIEIYTKEMGYKNFDQGGQFIATIYRTDEEFISMVDKIINQMKER